MDINIHKKLVGWLKKETQPADKLLTAMFIEFR
jgi:hypothetical protein